MNYEIHTKNRVTGVLKKALAYFLAVAMVFTTVPMLGEGWYANADTGLTLKTPVLTVTGTALTGGTYSKDNVSKEKSYTLEELQALGADATVSNQMYSSMKSKSPYSKNYHKASGVKLESLLDGIDFENTNVTVLASDGYKAVFTNDGEYAVKKGVKTEGLDKTRYICSGTGPTRTDATSVQYSIFNQTDEAVPTIIGWAESNTNLGDGSIPDKASLTADAAELGYLKLFLGQLNTDDMNNPLFNGKDTSPVNEVIAGDAIDEVVLTVGSKTYTRSDILKMQFAERTYDYTSSKGEQHDAARGVPFSVLLDGAGNNDTVSFTTADGYDMSSYTMTVKELVDGNYMLAYSVNGAGVYKASKDNAAQYGFLTLYGDGVKPASMITGVTVVTGSGIDFSKSPYKHITNGGIDGQDGPYNIDAITGATLTIEGPGMTTSTPLSVRDLETKNQGAFRGVYTDTRNSEEVTRTYEGIDVYYLLHNLTESNNALTETAYKVSFKNRNRQTIATLTLEEIEEMHNAGTPALVAYGTAYEDGTNPRPWVFNGATGEDTTLGNGDGCLKLVYDLDTYGDQDGTYETFGNMAYIYVEEEETPGFKHDKSPYNAAENSQYVLTVTGSEIGCEINYTVEQLENMVEYDGQGNVVDNGYGYRDEYCLANNSYWYVNTYEGVKLWSLLLHSGIDSSKATDDETIVSFTATDGYNNFDTFTLEEVADPDKFGFYEKNAADANDGTYVPNENIRQGGDISTGDKLGVGYPVMVAYGTNFYPYVQTITMDGYLSGLANEGGPLRIISGKREYSHANGSYQAKYLDKVVVGADTYNYSTHFYNDESTTSGAAYKALADNQLKITINDGSGKDNSKTYTVSDLEKLIYGKTLTKTQLGEAKIKGFYETSKNGNLYSDLYEGVNLNFFLTEVVKLTGAQGTITFKGGDADLEMSLEDVLATDNGYNGTTGVSGLSPVIAYAKNGYPLVTAKNDAGWVKTQTLKNLDGTDDATNSYTVQNHGGPLQLVFPRADADAKTTMGTMTGLTEIVINLEADAYAHIATPYDTYAESTITVSGEGTRIDGSKAFTVAELESNQSIATTKVYSLQGQSGDPTQIRYRGVSLYDFLKSTNVGLKNNAKDILIYTEDSEDPYTFSLSEIKNSYKNTVSGAEDLPVMLAYGSAAYDNADEKDGLPLVSGKTSEGYDAAYGNDGGPVKLIIGQTDVSDANKGKCIKNVTRIEVTASEQVSWNHSSSEIYKQYLTDTVEFEVIDTNETKVASKTYTVAELEAMSDIISQEEIFATASNTWEGLNFWNLIQRTFSTVEGIDKPITITVTARDGFSNDVVATAGLDALKNGVKDGSNYVPILLAYAVDGYPLASGGKGAGAVMGEGYDSSIDNKGGPMRLMVHNTQGACLMEVVKVTVKVGEVTPQETPDFTVTGVDNGELTVDDLKALTATEKEYTVKGTTEKVRGVLLSDLLASFGITDTDATFTINAGTFTGEGTYPDITLADAIAEEYLVAYEEYVGDEWVAINDTAKDPDSKVRIYRNYMEAHPEADQTKWYNKCQYLTGITVSVPQKTIFDVYNGTSQAGEMPLAGVRSTAMDNGGNLWVGTYGGGLVYKAKDSSTFVTYNKATTPALNSATVSAVCPDGNGGVYFTQNSSYSDGTLNSGVGYLKNGEVTYFRASDSPATIPNDYVQEIKIDKDGNVWFGSFGGLTKYNPNLQTWQTWDEEDGFPAMSIDNIEFDSNGGIWCGFYPDSEATDGSQPFTGGFAYFKDGQVVKSYQFTSTQDANTSTHRLGDVWVRDIAVDANGGAWIVASGSYGGMKNCGGKVWYVSAPGADAVEYTGFGLFGEDAFTTDSEIRMVTVDPDGGLWFGTSKDGIFRVDSPTVTAGKLTLTAQYSVATGSWTAAGCDNIYSLDFYGNTLYAGSSNGLATHKFEFNNEEPVTPPAGDAGDATADTAALAVTGDALARNGYFSVKGLKNAEGITKTTASFDWRNSSDETGTTSIEGDTIENIIKTVVGLDASKEVESIDVIAADGYTKTFTMDDIEATDLGGNKMMLAWSKDGGKCDLTLIVGQYAATDKNKGKWVSNIKSIVVHAKAAAQDAGDKTAEDADLTITGDALARNGYFSIKGLKNYEGITKVDATFHTLNSTGTEEDFTVQGATLENIISLIGIADGAEVGSIVIESSDGYKTTYTAKEALTADLQGNKAMFIWTEGTNKVTKVIRGQFSATDANKGAWARDVVKITVNAKTATDEVSEIIDNLPAAADITVEDADDIIAAIAAYEALSDAEKANVSSSVKAALEAAEDAVIDACIEEGTEAVDAIDYSKYASDQFLMLWTLGGAYSGQLSAADSAKDAAKALEKITEMLETVKTKAEIATEELNTLPVVAKATASNYNTVKLSWSTAISSYPVAYEVYKATAADGEYTLIASQAGADFTDTVDTGVTNCYKVRAYALVDGSKVYGDFSEVVTATTVLGKATVSKVTAGAKKATVTWKKVAGASGYEIQMSTKSGSGYKTIKTVTGASKLSFTKTGLKKGKTYYFKVRAYRVVNGEKVYGALSAAKSVKIKK